MLKLKNKYEPRGMPVKDLPEGKLATIVEWGNDGTTSPYVGAIVQKFENKLIWIGKGDSWSSHAISCKENRVRILEPGEELIIGD